MTDLTHNASLIHFAAQPLLNVESQQQEPDGARKPNGLWLSVEGDSGGWRDWCVSEEFDLDRLAVAHEVTLADDARILRITNAIGIDDFTHRYNRPTGVLARDVGYRMDWVAVARTYQGIIIAPHIRSRHYTMHTLWYCGWDCASGCIWDASAIASIAVVTVEAVTQ